MKKYKLLKDLPFAKAGEIFKEMDSDGRLVLAPEDWDQHRHKIYISDIKKFDKWFKEVENISDHFYIILGGKVAVIKYIDFSFDKETEQQYMDKKDECKSVGNCFETREEAEKYLEYLKSKAIIKQDTKGFTPDWHNVYELKFYGYYDTEDDALSEAWVHTVKRSIIYFKSVEDIKESFEAHPEEWKTYLTYE